MDNDTFKVIKDGVEVGLLVKSPSPKNTRESQKAYNRAFTDALNSGSIVRARLDDNSRIVGASLIKKDNITSLDEAEFTPCLENDYLIKNCPGWKLKANKIFQDNKYIE